MRKYGLLIVLFSLLIANTVFADGFQNFITRDGARLMDGDREFRFISFNIPNLHYVEDDMEFERTMPFRFPDEFEINDALQTIRQMGGQVARTYTLAVFQKSESPDTPKYVLGPGKFNEEAFQALDQVLALANKNGIRLIIPIVNNFKWWGGAEDYAAFRGKKRDEFWTDPQLIEDFKKTVEFVITRKNTVTGVPYLEDKSILAWETGNETQCPHSWTHEIIAYIKSLDQNHLVCDGYLTSVLREESIADDLVDIVQTHHYEKDPRQMVDNIKASLEKLNRRKPYMLGEFGFVGTEAVRAVLDTVIDNKLAGALIWSLRYHHRHGGFFWHSEPDGGDFFKAYHWPGFPTGDVYDETNLMAMMREKAFVIQGKPVPSIDAPKAPVLLPINDVGAISWQSSVGASGYDIERAERSDGPWTQIAYNVSDADVQYKPLYNDVSAEVGKSYYYRISARNCAGISPAGNIVGPVKVDFLTFVDELSNDTKMFFRSKELTIIRNQARRFKEDIHRLDGEKGAWLMYRVGGAMQACTLYTFSENNNENLILSASLDGKNFTKVEAKRKDFSLGEGEYGYLKPILYKATLPGKTEFLKIEYANPASLSRVEIHYKGSDE